MLALVSSSLGLNLAPAVGPSTRLASPVMQMGATVAPAVAAGRVVPSKGAVDSTILVQGGSLRTWSYRSPAVRARDRATRSRPTRPPRPARASPTK